MNSDEHILLRKLREGDTEALDILYLRYAAKVRDFAFRLLGDSVEAEDITHDIFLKVWEQRKTVGNVVSFRGYLFRMTRNAIFNAFKHGRWSRNTRPGLRRTGRRRLPIPTTAYRRTT